MIYIDKITKSRNYEDLSFIEVSKREVILNISIFTFPHSASDKLCRAGLVKVLENQTDRYISDDIDSIDSTDVLVYAMF